MGVVSGRAGLERVGFALALVTWLPLLALSPLASGSATVSLLQSLGTHARLLVAIPLFFAAEALFDARASQVIAGMVACRLIPATRLGRYQDALLQTIRRRDTWWVEIILAVLTAISIAQGLRVDLPAGLSTWRTTGTGQLTVAGWWYSLVSLPIFQFLIWRWCARMLLWWQLLWRINRLDLRLIPTHPDLSGGLGGFGVAHVTLAPVSLGLSTMLVATIAEEILWAGADLHRYVLPLASALIANVVIAIIPLLTFAPRLLQAKQQGLLEYGTLAAGYVRDFEDKWLRSPPPREPLLGSPDVQSLADLANSFDVIRSMRIAPIGLKQMLLLACAAALPAVPLALFVWPLDELIVRALQALFNV